MLIALQLIEHMGNDMFAFVGCGTVFVYSPNINKQIQSKYIGNQQGIQIISLGNEFSIVYKLSKNLFKHLLIQMEKTIETQVTFNLQIMSIHNSSHKQLQILSRQITKIKIYFQPGQEMQEQIQLKLVPTDKFFNFKIKPPPPNYQLLCDTTELNILAELPEQYLQVDLSNKVKVSKVQLGKKTLIYRSNLDQQFHLGLIEDILRRQKPDQLFELINEIVSKIFEKGNIEASDLLVEDIFGKEGCSFIGLPAKMMASSLGKFAIQEKTKSNLWDQLKSVLFAFAINIAKQIKYQIFATKIVKVILVADEFTSPYFLQLIDAVATLHGQVWFYSHRTETKFIQKLQKLNIKKYEKRQSRPL